MAEEATEEQKSGQKEETSTVGRLKGRLKELTGRGSGDEGKDSDEQPQGSAQEESDSGEQEEPQAQGESGESEGDSEAADQAGGDDYIGDYKVDEVATDKRAENEDEARAQVTRLEREGPPENLGDWPVGKGMYLSFGGAEGEEGYEEGPARQMGPSSLRHHADGSVEVQGEIVDNPEDYKADESVTEEADKLGMDKGAKSDGNEESEGEESSDDGSQAEGSSDDGSQAEGSEEASSQSEDSTSSDGSESEPSGEESESETSGAESEASGEESEREETAS